MGKVYYIKTWLIIAELIIVCLVFAITYTVKDDERIYK